MEKRVFVLTDKPLNAKVIYRAKSQDTGEIFEGETLKSLYRYVLHNFKGDMHNTTLYESRFCVIKKGLLVEYPGNVVEFFPFVDICSVFVSGEFGKVHSYIDREGGDD